MFALHKSKLCSPKKEEFVQYVLLEARTAALQEEHCTSVFFVCVCAFFSFLHPWNRRQVCGPMLPRHGLVPKSFCPQCGSSNYLQDPSVEYDASGYSRHAS